MYVDAAMHVHTHGRLNGFGVIQAVSFPFSLTYALCAVIPAPLTDTCIVCVTRAGPCAPC